MATMHGIAPIFAVHDLDAAVRHYQRLGFAVRAYAGGGYGFATRDGIEIHLGVVPAGDRRTSSAYLFVDNADELAAAWRSAGAEVHSPQDTEWGQHEGAVVDPDGNVIRFGSPIKPAARG
jgi:catechol 2,3-dioxygenase-like lactoylglutathione lyase family enzyme